MKKYLYELTNEELENNYNNEKVQEIFNFVNEHQECFDLRTAHALAKTFIALLEEEIEVLS